MYRFSASMIHLVSNHINKYVHSGYTITSQFRIVVLFTQLHHNLVLWGNRYGYDFGFLCSANSRLDLLKGAVHNGCR